MFFYNQLIVFGVIYLVLVLALTSIGNKRKIGGESVFFISLLFTPFIGLVFLLTSSTKIKSPTSVKFYTCPHCKFAISEKKQFCPICNKDEEGKTLLEYKEEFKSKEKAIIPKKEILEKPKIEIIYKQYNQN